MDHPSTPALDKVKFQMTPDAVRQDFIRVAVSISGVMDTCTALGGQSQTEKNAGFGWADLYQPIEIQTWRLL
ncbi:hypothetical protein CN539_22165 [Bacillus toyonensis]|nr:hypothetical protein CN625_15520 [Bacillus toyonensis]PEN71573.1 hypothetical protein CN539_22165 [Bacillus toyonensis]